MPEKIVPDTSHRPTEWILWFVSQFGCFSELSGHENLVLTEGKPDELPAGRFDPDKFAELYADDADEATRQTARLVLSVYNPQGTAAKAKPFDFVAWCQVSPRGYRNAVAMWMQSTPPYFP